MVDTLSRDCAQIIGGDFNMIERPIDKFNDYGRISNNLKHYRWYELLKVLWIYDSFRYQGGQWFLGNSRYMKKQED